MNYTVNMDESELEIQVGDILERQRMVSELLSDDSCESIAYGPIRLKLVKPDEILPADMDNRIYSSIEVPIEEPIQSQVSQVTDEADKCVEKCMDEL